MRWFWCSTVTPCSAKWMRCVFIVFWGDYCTRSLDIWRNWDTWGIIYSFMKFFWRSYKVFSAQAIPQLSLGNILIFLLHMGSRLLLLAGKLFWCVAWHSAGTFKANYTWWPEFDRTFESWMSWGFLCVTWCHIKIPKFIRPWKLNYCAFMSVCVYGTSIHMILRITSSSGWVYFFSVSIYLDTRDLYPAFTGLIKQTFARNLTQQCLAKLVFCSSIISAI